MLALRVRQARLMCWKGILVPAQRGRASANLRMVHVTSKKRGGAETWLERVKLQVSETSFCALVG